MKKLLTITGLLMILFIFTIPALACTGPLCYSTGDFKAGAKAGDRSFDYDVKTIKGGAAGGLSYGKGGALAIGGGHVNNATGGIDVTATGGGLSSTTTYKETLDVPDGFTGEFKSVKVGSVSEGVGVAGATLDLFIETKPDIPGSSGYAGGIIMGKAKQGTLNGSYIVLTNKFDSAGFTGGVAGQGSKGHFFGVAFVGSSGDGEDGGYFYSGGEAGGPGWYVKDNGTPAGKVKYFANGHPEGNSEWTFLGATQTPVVIHNAGLNADISMQGMSYSESYRYRMIGDGWQTEGLGTNVGAMTDVVTSGNVAGSFTAHGGATTLTVQNGAVAGAVGSYSGGGTLGSGYTGSAVGYSSTSTTTFTGMNGSVNTAAAGMKVSSQVTYDNPGIPD